MGQNYSTICLHPQLKMQQMKGDGVHFNEYARFTCSDCHMNSFRYRKQNSFWDSAWKPWQPRNEESCTNVGESKFLGECNLGLCNHINMSQHGTRGNTGQGMFEEANMKCIECGLNQKYERQLGKLYDSKWIKSGTLIIS